MVDREPARDDEDDMALVAPVVGEALLSCITRSKGGHGAGCDLPQMSEGVREDAAAGKAQFGLKRTLREPAADGSRADVRLPGGIGNGWAVMRAEMARSCF